MFRFPLQSVLEHRKHQEEALQKEMAALQQRLDTERQRANVLCACMVENQRRFSGMQRNGAKACDLQLMIRYLDRLKGNIAQQEETVRRAMQRIEHKRADLIEAVKRRKVIEKLKEKAEHAYREETHRKETNLINEIAISGFNRRRGRNAKAE